MDTADGAAVPTAGTAVAAAAGDTEHTDGLSLELVAVRPQQRGFRDCMVSVCVEYCDSWVLGSRHVFRYRSITAQDCEQGHMDEHGCVLDA